MYTPRAPSRSLLQPMLKNPTGNIWCLWSILTRSIHNLDSHLPSLTEGHQWCWTQAFPVKDFQVYSHHHFSFVFEGHSFWGEPLPKHITGKFPEMSPASPRLGFIRSTLPVSFGRYIIFSEEPEFSALLAVSLKHMRCCLVFSDEEKTKSRTNYSNNK